MAEDTSDLSAVLILQRFRTEAERALADLRKTRVAKDIMADARAAYAKTQADLEILILDLSEIERRTTAVASSASVLSASGISVPSGPPG